MKIKNRHKKIIQGFINYFLGPLLFIWVSYSIYQQVIQKPDLALFWKHVRSSDNNLRIWTVIGIVLLMFLNWAIEAMKWMLAIRKIQRINFLTSFKAILSGVSFSVSTPNRVGEYLGRVLYMEDGKRLKAISLTITGSISQLLVTLLMGLIGLIILRSPVERSGMISMLWLDIIIYGTLLVTIVLTVFYFRLSWLVRVIDRVPGAKRFSWLIEALEEFNATLLLQLLSLSAIRFLVFIIQYYLAFRLFEVDISWWQGWWAVSLSFLVMAIIPTITLFTDLVFREKIALQIIGLFSQNALGIGLATLSIWLINLIIPALAGSLLILSVKRVFRDKTELRE